MSHLFLAADIGNTLAKLGLWNLDTMLLRLEFSSARLMRPETLSYELLGHFRRAGLSSGIEFESAFSSVVPEYDESMIEVLERLGAISIKKINGMMKFPFRIVYRSRESVGADRLAGCARALELSGKKNVVTVDLGTATTINIVKSGTFVGGPILPGFKHFLDFPGTTHRLRIPEKVDLKASKYSSTPDAIQYGIVRGYKNMVTATLDEILKKNWRDEGPAVFITGGNAELMSDIARGRAIVSRDLVLEGVRLLGVRDDS